MWYCIVVRFVTVHLIESNMKANKVCKIIKNPFGKYVYSNWSILLNSWNVTSMKAMIKKESFAFIDQSVMFELEIYEL